MNWRRALLAVAFAVPVIGLLGYGLTQDPAAIPSPLPGKPAPQFALRVFAPGEQPLAMALGDTVRLATYRGHVLVLNFWASWCVECRSEHATLSRIAKTYAGRDVHFFGVLYNDTPSNGLQWLEDMQGQAYPSLTDPHTRTAIDYGLYGVPETFFVARDGQVAYKHIGPIPEGVLVRKIDSLLAATAPQE